MKTHTPPQASVKDLSDFFASVVIDPNRPIQLTEPGTTIAPHRLLDCFQKVEESTVLELLQSIDDRKSAGSDGLPGCILKNYAKDLTQSVTECGRFAFGALWMFLSNMQMSGRSLFSAALL